MTTIQTQADHVTRRPQLAWAGVLAPLVLSLTLIAFAILQPDYNHATQAISDLGIQGAPFATLWNSVGFGLVGALIVGFAWSLERGLRPERGARLVAALAAISGLGWMGLGLAPAAPAFQPSTQTTVHFLMVAVNFFPFLLVAFVFGMRWRVHPYWRLWALLSLLIGMVALGSFLIPPAVPPGLSQRIGIGAYFVWVLMMGAALWHKPGDG